MSAAAPRSISVIVADLERAIARIAPLQRELAQTPEAAQEAVLLVVIGAVQDASFLLEELMTALTGHWYLLHKE